MKEYSVGLVTGILLSVSCMLFISAQSSYQRLSLGELTVNQLSVKNEQGVTLCTIGGKDAGILTLYKNTEPFAVLDAEGGQSASLSLYNTGKQHLIQSRIADGKFQSFDVNGTAAAMIGIDDNLGGMVAIRDNDDSLACLMTSRGELSMFHTNDAGHFSSRIRGNATAAFLNSEDSSGVFFGLNAAGTGGMLRFMNHYGKTTGIIGTNSERDGQVTINDRYGNTGWEQSGKLNNKTYRNNE